jgi:hypothetical protein
MTVNLEVPVITYLGNGITTDFTFSWSSGYPDEIYVKRDGVELKEGVEYELENYEEAHGGSIVFPVAPAVGVQILIYRQTPVTQQVDYVDFEAFPADTHEFQMDKDTRILQEIISGGRGVGGPVNLQAIHWPTYVEIDNSAGNNAFIQPWTTDGLLSGVSLGEVVEQGGPTPIDGDATSKPDGYIWWELGPAPNTGGDPTIIMWTTQVEVASTFAAPTQAVAEFRYDALTGEVKYGYDPLQPLVDPVWTTEGGISPAPVALLQYWIRFEVITGAAIEYLGSPVDTWIDAFAYVVGQEWMGWYVADPGASQTVVARFHIAPDDGGGSPDLDLMITRNVVLTAVQT